MPNRVDYVHSALSRAKYYNPKLLTLTVDSAEGSIVSAEEIILALKAKSKALQVPYLTFAHTYALGPGFVLLASGDKSYANPHSVLGGLSASISSLGLVKFLDKWKVKYTSVATTPTRLDPFQKLTAQDEAWAQSQLKHRQKVLTELLTRQPKGPAVSSE